MNLAQAGSRLCQPNRHCERFSDSRSRSRFAQSVNRPMQDTVADFQFVAVGGDEVGDCERHGAIVVAERYRGDGQFALVEVF